MQQAMQQGIPQEQIPGAAPGQVPAPELPGTEQFSGTPRGGEGGE